MGDGVDTSHGPVSNLPADLGSAHDRRPLRNVDVALMCEFSLRLLPDPSAVEDRRILPVASPDTPGWVGAEIEDVRSFQEEGSLLTVVGLEG